METVPSVVVDSSVADVEVVSGSEVEADVAVVADV